MVVFGVLSMASLVVGLVAAMHFDMLAALSEHDPKLETFVRQVQVSSCGLGPCLDVRVTSALFMAGFIIGILGVLYMFTDFMKFTNLERLEKSSERQSQQLRARYGDPAEDASPHSAKK
jgi:hypothetical protein